MDDETLERVLRFIERRCPNARCGVCDSPRLALILAEDRVRSEAVAAAVAAGTIVIAERRLPEPPPTWVCRACGAWNYYDGEASRGLRAI